MGLLGGSVELPGLLPPRGRRSALMALVGLAASAVPAMRALRVQPTEALKGVG